MRTTGPSCLQGLSISGNVRIHPIVDAENPLSSLTAQGNGVGIRQAALSTLRLLTIEEGTMIEVGRGTNTEIETAFRSAGGDYYVSLENTPQSIKYSTWRRAIPYAGSFLTVDPGEWSRLPARAVVFWGCWETRGISGKNFTIQLSSEAEFYAGRSPFSTPQEAVADGERRALEISAGLVQRSGTIFITSMRYALHQTVMRNSAAALVHEYEYFKQFLANTAAVVSPPSIVLFGVTKERFLTELNNRLDQALLPFNKLLSNPLSRESGGSAARDLASNMSELPSSISLEMLDVEIDTETITVRERDIALLYDVGIGFRFADSLPDGAIARIDGVALDFKK